MKTTKTDIPCKKLICRKSKGKIVKYAQKLKNGGSKYSMKKHGIVSDIMKKMNIDIRLEEC